MAHAVYGNGEHTVFTKVSRSVGGMHTYQHTFYNLYWACTIGVLHGSDEINKAVRRVAAIYRGYIDFYGRLAVNRP